MENNFWKNKGQQWVYEAINPFIKLLIKLGITPNFITFMGLVINILATIIFITGVEKGSRRPPLYRLGQCHHIIGGLDGYD